MLGLRPLILLSIALAGCSAATAPPVPPRASAPAILADRAAAATPAPPRTGVSLTYLGVAGWQLTNGKTTILVDPYFSRRPFPRKDELIVPDEKVIAAYAPAHADLILVEHSHVDHLLDVPSIARRTGASIVGTESTVNFAHASGIPDNQIIPVKGGEDYAFPGFSVRVIPGLHSAINDKHGLGGPRTIPADVKLPLSFEGFAEGGTLAYLVRLDGHEILFISSANYIERELEGIHPEVAVVATGLRQEIHDYSCRLMRVLGRPSLVLADHFDEWTKPLGPLPMELSAETKADLGRFAEEIHACAPEARVVVPEHFRVIPLR